VRVWRRVVVVGEIEVVDVGEVELSFTDASGRNIGESLSSPERPLSTRRVTPV
jgi:hypothetical protein